MHDYNQIAAIVGEEKIDALREAGVNIADKPTKPTTGLLGRWVRDPDDKDALIVSEHAKKDGWVWVAFCTDASVDGAATMECQLSSLTFPEETTRPEDVPVGEAWIVELDGGLIGKVNALKIDHDAWKIANDIDRMIDTWSDEYVDLIAPLVPARPVDSDRERTYWEQQQQIDSYERERTPETVTTADEYAALPEGSIVAEQGGVPYFKEVGGWVCREMLFDDIKMAITTRTVLRKGEKK